MKNPLSRFLIIASVLSTSIAFAQNPPPPPERGNRPPPRQSDGDHRDEPRGPDDRAFPDGPPPRPDGERTGRPPLRDRSRDFAQIPHSPQPYLGVVTRPLDPSLSTQLGFTPGLGLVVEELVPDGPAARAGLQKMDVIKQLNDQLVSNPPHLAALVRHFGKDAEVTVLVLRKGQEQKVAVKIGEHMMPEPAAVRASGFGGMPGGEFPLDFQLREELQRNADGPRDFQERSQPRRPRPSDDILREVGPGGAPEVQVHRDQVSTTWNTSSAKVALKDQNGEIEVRSENGKRTLTAKNAKGETAFDGPIDTEEQRKAVPAEFRKMLEQVEVRSHVEQRPGGGSRTTEEIRGSTGAPAPGQPGRERFKPRRGEPEVQ